MAEIKPPKAYVVHDGDEGWAVVFASNGATARRKGAGELNCSFEDIESCRRRPAFDEYSPGPVPKLALIASGWWLECWGCGRRIDDEMYDYEVDKQLNLTPVEDGQRIYCSAGCRMHDLARTARERKIADETREVMVGLVLARYSHTTIHGDHVYVREDDSGWPEVRQAIIRFSFPGCRYFGAEIRYEADKPGIALYVANGDSHAWNVWIAAGCPATSHLDDDRAT